MLIFLPLKTNVRGDIAPYRLVEIDGRSRSVCCPRRQAPQWWKQKLLLKRRTLLISLQEKHSRRQPSSCQSPLKPKISTVVFLLEPLRQWPCSHCCSGKVHSNEVHCLAQNIGCRMIVWIMNTELERVWKEAVVVLFKLLSRYSLGKTETTTARHG